MARWQVKLEGEHFDLEELPKPFASDQVRVVESDGVFLLEAAAFESCGSAGDVWQRAIEVLARVNGAARLTLFGYRPAELSHLYEVTETGRNVTVFAESIEFRVKVGAFLVHASADVRDLPAPPKPLGASDWARLAEEDASVHDVLELVSAREDSWDSLYKVMELLQANDGIRLLPELGISKKKLRAFTRTANSIRAVGKKARHADYSFEPPKKPMTLSEASKLIRTWAKAWLEQKIASSKPAPTRQTPHAHDRPTALAKGDQAKDVEPAPKVSRTSPQRP